MGCLQEAWRGGTIRALVTMPMGVLVGLDLQNKNVCSSDTLCTLNLQSVKTHFLYEKFFFGETFI